jgi:hypothetical protein
MLLNLFGDESNGIRSRHTWFIGLGTINMTSCTKDQSLRGLELRYVLGIC